MIISSRSSSYSPDFVIGSIAECPSSECGRFWVNDRLAADGILITVGSIEIGKWANLCQMGGHMLRFEAGHAHPYMAPDKSRVSFVSTRTGTPKWMR